MSYNRKYFSFRLGQIFCAIAQNIFPSDVDKYLCYGKKKISYEIKANEKARKMKKAFCFNICSPHFLWQNVSMSGLRISKLPRTKKGNLGEHFSASACGLGFKKLSLGSLLSTSVTLGKTKITVEKFSVIVN